MIKVEKRVYKSIDELTKELLKLKETPVDHKKDLLRVVGFTKQGMIHNVVEVYYLEQEGSHSLFLKSPRLVSHFQICFECFIKKGLEIQIEHIAH